MSHHDVYVHIMDLKTVSEAVTENEDGSYSVFIDDRLSPIGRLDAYSHAIHHIGSDDFRRSDVQRIESEGHNVY